MPDANAAWRTSNPGTLMYTATGLCIQEKLRFVQHAGYPAMTDAQLALFHHLDPAGTRLTTLAARAGLTKQSMVELVDKAEALGLATRQPDAGDQRAKLVLPTPGGLCLLDQLRAGVEATESRMAAIVGTGFLAELARELGGYAATRAAAHNPLDAGRDVVAPGQSTARTLALAARRFAAQALKAAHRHGYHDVTETLLPLFRNLDLGGTRLTEIAVRARMTKQSMRELVDRAELLGYVFRVADPADGRAKIIALRPSGLAMLDEMRIGLIAAEQDLAAATAPGFVVRLKSGLATYIQQCGTPAARPEAS